MPDDFADALDRMDISFEDAANTEFLMQRLTEVLGHSPSLDQWAIARGKFRDQQQQAVNAGFRLTRFQRGADTVLQLRDARGRFVTDTRLRLDDRGSIVAVGKGRISDALRQAGAL